MPNEIKAWVCDSGRCRPTYRHERSCATHEKSCLSRPENKGCFSCAHHQDHRSEEYPGCDLEMFESAEQEVQAIRLQNKELAVQRQEAYGEAKQVEDFDFFVDDGPGPEDPKPADGSIIFKVLYNGSDFYARLNCPKWEEGDG